MSSLGVLLLYFTCKCAILLAQERRNREKRSSDLSTAQSFHRETLSSINFLPNEILIQW
ncbi:hypothetical protein GYH30_025011 [Glycine max]|nr:hypothetical protein GYH30_025011 [Glycine max]